jgi:type I restriction enzyme S subunit
LRTPMCIEEFRRASKGIADFRQRLYWEHFRQVRVVLPPIEEQRAIAQRIQLETTAIDRVIVSIKASIDRLHELRSALITAAVTGQIDVATWGKRGTTDRQLDAIEANMAAAAQPERQQVRA